VKTTVTTLVLLRRGDEVLLAMKKRGFGAGRWNGVGGKLEPGESLEQALVRECHEEIGVTPLQYHKVAEHNFHEYHEGEQKQMLVHAYVCTEWRGEPAESEEMAPRWFQLADIPYDEMWSDDPHWLPQVLEGKLVTSTFTLDEHDNLVEHEVTEVSGF
jgi:8-oxo-dGTP diphosphatase/2-hydroxy-dATP diphosphatase